MHGTLVFTRFIPLHGVSKSIAAKGDGQLLHTGVLARGFVSLEIFGPHTNGQSSCHRRQGFVECPQRQSFDNGGSQEMDIDPSESHSVQSPLFDEGKDVFVTGGWYRR